MAMPVSPLSLTIIVGRPRRAITASNLRAREIALLT
jgi:hypothetical protein